MQSSHAAIRALRRKADTTARERAQAGWGGLRHSVANPHLQMGIPVSKKAGSTITSFITSADESRWSLWSTSLPGGGYFCYRGAGFLCNALRR